MTALVYGFVRAASDGLGRRASRSRRSPPARSCSPRFVVTETRAEQPITPLHLFASRQRSGAYVARVLVVGRHVLDVLLPDAVPAGRATATARSQAGLAFLPMTAVMFAMGRVVPRLVRALRRHARAARRRLALAAARASRWLSRISAGHGYFPHIAAAARAPRHRHGHRLRAADHGRHRRRRAAPTRAPPRACSTSPSSSAARSASAS